MEYGAATGRVYRLNAVHPIGASLPNRSFKPVIYRMYLQWEDETILRLAPHTMQS